VLNYLVGNGVDESRLDAQGMGPGQPVGDNDTEEGRALNRRIEFAVG
jgi:OOP family OmpA-OmpF porin